MKISLSEQLMLRFEKAGSRYVRYACLLDQQLTWHGRCRLVLVVGPPIREAEVSW